MRDIYRDIRGSARLFWRSPGLATSVAITVAVGVGASLAIFGLLHDTLIGRSPFHDPDRLIVVQSTGRYYYGGTFSEGVPNSLVSWPDYTDIEAQCRTVSAIGAFAYSYDVLAGGDQPRPVERTPGLFAAVQARPQLGRLLDAQDFRPGAPPAAWPGLPLAPARASPWRGRFRRSCSASNPRIPGRSRKRSRCSPA